MSRQTVWQLVFQYEKCHFWNKLAGFACCRLQNKKLKEKSKSMTLRSYLWGMRISCIIAFAAWAVVVWHLDPEKAGLSGLLIFYVCTFLFLSSLFILLFTRIRKNFGTGEEWALTSLGMSFREGILLALLSILLLFFQQNRILTWWDGALAVAGIFLIELYFLTRR
ncbi:MAG TPA: hypothetical protein PLF30_04510 [Candidatus Moranbacteria bacterium]|jgi:hypothetical protein|nr:hypothetical protein [Candidatus Moranbacteria bacterium]HOF42474.1 hypothetical protein [Candidatus Moranbacteria bacterium]HPX94788.1 hypothetical protein [Candidatus Moranbacteria bacterium]HQB59993.1 hypothetical protein [Candidatus Moranbacteria bacterium]